MISISFLLCDTPCIDEKYMNFEFKHNVIFRTTKMINCHVNVLTIDLIDLIRPLKAKYVQKSIRLLCMIGIIVSSTIL